MTTTPQPEPCDSKWVDVTSYCDGPNSVELNTATCETRTIRPEHLEMANADLVETIARAVHPDALWDEPDKGAPEWWDWSVLGPTRTAARLAARRVIAALGLTEERRVLSLRGSDGEMERTEWDSIDDARYQWPDREFVAGVHWVTPWQEDDE